MQDRKIGVASGKVVTGGGESSCVSISEFSVQLAELASTRQAWRHRGDNPFAQPGVERRARQAKIMALQFVARYFQVGASDVNAAHRCSRHTSEDPHPPIRLI